MNKNEESELMQLGFTREQIPQVLELLDAIIYTVIDKERTKEKTTEV